MALITYPYPSMAGYIWDNYIYQNVQLGATDKYLNFAYNFWTYDEAPFDDPGFVVAINSKTVFSIAAGDIRDEEFLIFEEFQIVILPFARTFKDG